MEITQTTVNMSSSLTSRDFIDTLYTQISDDSFLKSEQDCRDEIEFEDLLGSQEVPDLNDTLDEINFILELGNKLNQEGKLRTPNNKHRDNNTGTSYSFKTAQMTESDKILKDTNKTVDMSGISFLIDKSEIQELKKCNNYSNDTTNIEDISEISDVSENRDQNNLNDTNIIDDSLILDDTQQSENESYFNSIMSENGSIDEENDESTLEDEKLATNQAEIFEIDDSLEDSVIEIFD